MAASSNQDVLIKRAIQNKKVNLDALFAKSIKLSSFTDANSYYNSLLEFSSQIGNINIVQSLLKHIQTVSPKNKAIDLAVKKGYTSIVKLLLTDERASPIVDGLSTYDYARQAVTLKSSNIKSLIGDQAFANEPSGMVIQLALTHDFNTILDMLYKDSRVNSLIKKRIV